jgi:hypothetical protein
VSPDDAPAPAGRTAQARHAAATIALALAFAIASLLTGLAGPGPLQPADGLLLPGVAEAAAPAVEASDEAEPGDLGGGDAARHRILRAMWLAVLPAVALAVAGPVRVAWRRRRDTPRPDRAHPGRTRAVRPPPAALPLLA